MLLSGIRWEEGPTKDYHHGNCKLFKDGKYIGALFWRTNGTYGYLSAGGTEKRMQLGPLEVQCLLFELYGNPTK